MDPSCVELWQKISAFRVTSPGTIRSYERRLADENGWSYDHALRVIEEYRRFVLLACVAGHPVCPSEDVDAAWHLHLVYTQSYWDAFCGQTLGRPLHHTPTLGGSREEAKHRAMYVQTLASYRRIFGEAPPRDLWPDVDARFGADAETVRIKPSDWWLVPRVRLRTAAAFVAVAALLGAAAGCGNGVFLAVGGPWDLRGPEFLALYSALFVVLSALTFLVRRWARRPASEGGAALTDPYALAYVAAGHDRAVESAVASLVLTGRLKLGPGHRLIPGESTSTEAHALERDLLQIVRERGQVTFADLYASGRLRERTQGLDESLVASGHLAAAGRALATRLATGGGFLLLAVFGATKIQVGLLRERPVGILIAMTIVTAIVGVALLFWRTRPTLRSSRLMRRLRSETAAKPTNESSPRAVGLTVALFGMATLLGTALQALHAACFVRNGTGGSDGGSTSPSGCGGGGGGGCGGGGGGGGGCGGCGG